MITYDNTIYKYSDYLITKHKNKYNTSMPLERLQKLLFIAYVYSIVNYDEKMFENKFEIGKYGPTIKQIDIHYCDTININPIHKELIELPHQKKTSLDYAFNNCLEIDTIQMISNCSLYDAPWKIDNNEFINKWGFKLGDEIPYSLIKKYYTNYNYRDKNELTHYGELFFKK